MDSLTSWTTFPFRMADAYGWWVVGFHVCSRLVFRSTLSPSLLYFWISGLSSWPAWLCGSRLGDAICNSKVGLNMLERFRIGIRLTADPGSKGRLL